MSRLRFVLVAALLGTAACDASPFRPKAEFPVQFDTLGVYALNGSPRTAPTAIYFYASVEGTGASTVGSARNFDLAFDLDAQGNVVLLPIQVVAPALADHAVGLKAVPESFDALTRAPSGFRYDSSLVVAPGKTVAVEITSQRLCPVVYYGSTMYAKIVVDSVQAADRRIFVRYASNVNCGYTSLKAGTPED
jgi:hypothetical protein